MISFCMLLEFVFFKLFYIPLFNFDRTIKKIVVTYECEKEDLIFTYVRKK